MSAITTKPPKSSQPDGQQQELDKQSRKSYQQQPDNQARKSHHSQTQNKDPDSQSIKSQNLQSAKQKSEQETQSRKSHVSQLEKKDPDLQSVKDLHSAKSKKEENETGNKSQLSARSHQPIAPSQSEHLTHTAHSSESKKSAVESLPPSAKQQRPYQVVRTLADHLSGVTGLAVDSVQLKIVIIIPKTVFNKEEVKESTYTQVRLISVSADCRIKLWSLQRTLASMIDERKTVVHAFEEDLKILNVDIGKCVQTYVAAHKAPITCVALQEWGTDQDEVAFRDGRRVHRLITASDDKTIKVWRINEKGDLVDDQSRVLTLTGHKGKILPIVSCKYL
jgi:hypothetical protein